MTRNRNRLVLLLIAALFFAPLLAAILLQSKWFDYEPEHTVNIGALVQPPVALPLESLELVGGGDPAAALGGQWVLVHVLPAPCDPSCIDVVTQLRQIHLATGRHQDEVSVLLWGPATQQAALTSIYDRFLLSPARDAGRTSFLEARDRSGGTGSLPGTTYIADPEGNLMLRHAPGYEPGMLAEDLDKLLKWSGR